MGEEDDPKKLIERELHRIAVELRQPWPNDRYVQLYAAQQALSWATFPRGFMAPYDAITGGKVLPLIADTQGD